MMTLSGKDTIPETKWIPHPFRCLRGIPAIRIRISCNDQISLATQDEMNTAGTIRTTTIE